MRKFALIIFCSCPLLVFAQAKMATTDEGERVQLSPDHTWQYYQDTVLAGCSKLIRTHSDEVSGIAREGFARFINIIDGTSGVGVSMIQASKKNQYLFILSVVESSSPSCIPEGASCLILFTDGTRMMVSNDTRFNCDGVFTARLNMDQFTQWNGLAAKQIKIIRIHTSTGFVEVNPTKEQALGIQQSAQCLIMG